MGINYIGGAVAQADTVDMPTHQAEDLIVVFAYTQSNVVPTLVAGYTSVDANTNSGGFHTAIKVATSGEETVGNWLNAEGIAVHVYRSGEGTLSAGSSPSNDNNLSTVANYPALSLDDSDGSSWVVGFTGNTSNNVAADTPPLGMVNRTFLGGGGALRLAGHDTGGGVTEWTAQTADQVNNGFWHTSVIEIVETPSSVVITSVTDPVRTDSEITVVVEGAGDTQGTGSVEQNQGALITSLTVNSWADLEVRAQSLDIETTSYSYGTHEIKITNGDGDSATTTFEAIPAINNSAVDITSVATIGDRLQPLAVGNQVSYQSFLYLDGVITTEPVLVNPNGTYSYGDGSPIPSGIYTFDFRIFDHTDLTWGTVGTETVNIAPAAQSSLVITGSNVPDGTYSGNVWNVDSGVRIGVFDFVFSGGDCSLLLPDIAIGTEYDYLIKGGNPRVTGIADFGFTV